MKYFFIKDPYDTVFTYKIVTQKGEATKWSSSIEGALASPFNVQYSFETPPTESNIIKLLDYPSYQLIGVIQHHRRPNLELIKTKYPELLL